MGCSYKTFPLPELIKCTIYDSTCLITQEIDKEERPPTLLIELNTHW